MWKTKTIESLPSLFLLTNSVTWFSLTWVVLGNLLENNPFDTILLVSGAYFGALIVSAIMGATVLRKNLRGKGALLLWILVGTFTCVFSAVLVPEGTTFTLISVSLLLGASAGLGIPTCLAFFADHSKIEHRGRVAAILLFAIQVLTALIYIPISDAGVDIKFLILAAWKFIAVVSIFFFKSPVKLSEERVVSLSSIIRERTFVFYFVPWFLFTLVNFIEAPLLEKFFGTQLFSQYMWIENIIVSISAFLGGTLCDLKGRRVAGIFGFVLLGLGYAFLSLLPDAQLSQIFYVVFDGVAWGVLYVTFIFVVWGDVASGKNSEKYYLLGCMPFLVSGLIEVLVQPFVGFIPIAASFSLASLFLFLAILPLFYVSETLPEKAIKERELKGYVEKAQKVAQKEAEKSQKKNLAKAEKENKKRKEEANEETQESPEDEEARKLAEKYY